MTIDTRRRRRRQICFIAAGLAASALAFVLDAALAHHLLTGGWLSGVMGTLTAKLSLTLTVFGSVLIATALARMAFDTADGTGPQRRPLRTTPVPEDHDPG